MKYECVPDILTGKDLDYLKDIFNWNYGAYKNTLSAIESICDEMLQKHLEKCAKEFYNQMDNVLQILEGGNNENSK